MGVRAKITGTGMYVPDRVVTNDDLAALMDTSDEWIRQRSGIGTRRHIDPGQAPSELALHATERALAAADRSPAEVDCVILATLSGEADFPGTSFFLHERMELEGVPCFDLRAQCSGFVYALSVANAFVKSRHSTAGCSSSAAKIHSTGHRHLTTEGRDVAVLFGDGAGADRWWKPTKTPDDPGEILEVRLHAEGKLAPTSYGSKLRARGSQPVRITPGAPRRRSATSPACMGRFVFKHATTAHARGAAWRRSRRPA